MSFYIQQKDIQGQSSLVPSWDQLESILVNFQNYNNQQDARLAALEGLHATAVTNVGAETFEIFFGSVPIGSLATQANAATSYIDTGLSASVSPSGSGKAFSFVRVYGSVIATVDDAGHLSSAGAIGWGWMNNTLGNGNVGIKFNFRNNATTTTLAVGFAASAVIGYA